MLVKKTEVAEEVMKMLQHDGVNTNRLRKLNNFNDVQAIKNASFDGLGCDKVLARFDEYLKISGSIHQVLGSAFPLHLSITFYFPGIVFAL